MLQLPRKQNATSYILVCHTRKYHRWRASGSGVDCRFVHVIGFNFQAFMLVPRMYLHRIRLQSLHAVGMRSCTLCPSYQVFHKEDFYLS